MATDSKAVRGRRVLKFSSLDEVVADAEKLVSDRHTRMLGAWPLGTLLAHLAITINGSIDGFTGRAPWFIRLFSPLIKPWMLQKGMRAGFKLPKAVEAHYFPANVSPQAGLDGLRAAVARSKAEPMVAPHPVLGRMTHDEWNQIHLRHCELHLSFAVPD